MGRGGGSWRVKNPSQVGRFLSQRLLINHMYMHVCVCVHMRICAGMDVCVRVCVHMCVCTSAGSCAGQRCLILWSWSYRSFKLPDSGTGH